MQTEPKLEHRDAQHYVGIRADVTMDTLGQILPPLIGEILAWLGQQNVASIGAPFFRFIVVDMEKGLEMEVGVPVAGAMAGNGRIQPAMLPAGRYALVHYTGPYEGLVSVTADLLAWAERNDVLWAKSVVDGKEVWQARLECYLTDPVQEPDPQKWETIIAFLTAEVKVE